MTIKTRLQSISANTRQMLSEGETEQIDYKKTPESISADDLVAFANHRGGQFLVGVAESDRDGPQRGKIVGCNVSDNAILQILNRATSVIPPVSIDIFTENLSVNPILRIVVPESANRPHCTPKGTYCRRDGTRTRALHPHEILDIFLHSEARAFAQRFESAAKTIADDLDSLESTLDSSIQRMADQLGWADSQLGDTESNVSATLGLAARIDDRTRDVNDRLRALLQQEGRTDPVKEAERRRLIEQLVNEIEGDRRLRNAVIKGATLAFEAKGKTARELTEDELREAMETAGKIVRKNADLARYSRETKAPNDCSKEEIEAFIRLVNRGGEVSDGIKNRIARARSLGFVMYDGHPVGVASVKRPLKSYREGVFTKAKSPVSCENFKYELGWIFLKDDHRQKGQMTPLIDELLSELSDAPIFATARSSNVVMIQILEHFEFEKSGAPYPSSQHPGESVQLFTRAKMALKK